MSYLKRKKSSLENSILSVWSEAAKKEGNAFGKAVTDAKENGDKSFMFAGKKYDVEETLKKIKETNKNDKSDDGEGMDAVQPKAVKKKFKDRKDKDIDNDGDVDSSDKYLHKRRKAVSKAIKNERMEKGIDKLPRQFLNPDKEVMIIKKGKVIVIDKKDQDRYTKQGWELAEITKENYEVGTKARRDHTIETTPGQSKEDFEKQVEVMHKKKNSMREALAKMWGIDEGKNPFDKKEDKKYTKGKSEGKTLTGKSETKVEVEPKMEKKK